MSREIALKNPGSRELPDLVNKLLHVKSKEAVVTIILNLENPGDKESRKLNREKLRLTFEKAKELLEHKGFSGSETERMVLDMEILLPEFQVENHARAVGIYLGMGFREEVFFPFPVEDKIHVDHHFNVQDLLYFHDYLKSFYLLDLSKGDLHLYKGEGPEVEEIVDQNFPREYEETYEYQKPSEGTSFSNAPLKSYEQDKSEMNKIRRQDFFRKASHLLAFYPDAFATLVLAGVPEEIAEFQQVAGKGLVPLALVKGHYHSSKIHELGEAAWESIRTNMLEAQKERIVRLAELKRRRILSTGLENILEAVEANKGDELFVEKDFIHNYLADSPFRAGPNEIEGIPLERLLHQLYVMVDKKGGKITLMENQSLKEFGHIALLLRF